MVYNAIGLMSGSSLDGLDIVFAEFNEQAGHWTYEIKASACYAYPDEWKSRLQDAIHLVARDYLILHSEYGHYLGREVSRFIEENDLAFRVGLIASHGHTTFHMPGSGMTAQLGDGAAIAAETRLPVISDLRALDVAFGGQGAPIVPIGERSLLTGYEYYLNIGGIANISYHSESYIAFDICPANRVLNLLANEKDREYDPDGSMAASGKVDENLLQELNKQEYYIHPYPKSLANAFGTDIMYPLVRKASTIEDALATYVEHIAIQVSNAVENLPETSVGGKLLATGGGALNKYLVSRIASLLERKNIQVVVPDSKLVNYKEALIMAFIGVLRWRQETNVLSSVTGASQDSVGGALWIA